MRHYYSAALMALFISVSGSVYGQQEPPAVNGFRQSVEFGAGPGYMGTGDYQCLKTYLGYSRLLTKRLGLGTRVAMISGSSPLNLGPFSLAQIYHAVNLENEVLVAPFRNDRRLVPSVGLGGFVGYLNQLSYPTAAYYTDLNGRPALQYTTGPGKAFNAGYLFSLNLDAALDEPRKWLAGAKVSFQNDKYGNSYTGWQARVTRQF